MKNKKIIFLVATVCCLAVCWLCFGAWTIADSTFVPSDFAPYANSVYFFIIPSPNITSDRFSNVAVDLVYTSRGNSTSVFSISRTLDDGYFSRLLSKGAYGTSLTTFSRSYSVEIAIAISAIDVSLGDYFISAVYVPDSDGNLDNVTSFHRNFVRYSFPSNARKNLIVFIDKVPTNGVPQQQYDELLQRYEDLEYDFSDLESDYDDLLIEAQEYYAMYEQELALNTALNTQVAELQARIDSLESGGTALDFVGTAFEKVGDILQIEILPNITIGTIVAVPLILGVVFLVLRLVRGE